MARVQAEEEYQRRRLRRAKSRRLRSTSAGYCWHDSSKHNMGSSSSKSSRWRKKFSKSSNYRGSNKCKHASHRSRCNSNNSNSPGCRSTE